MLLDCDFGFDYGNIKFSLKGPYLEMLDFKQSCHSNQVRYLILIFPPTLVEGDY